jgi:outer membrane protein insertion porin family/translocation and assembly module TamA
VPFLNPSTASQQLALKCDPTQGPIDPAICSIPVGGFTLWELSVELRYAISGPFETALFCDSGDVSARSWNVRPSHLHLSCGLGVRYDTPVGPIRLDVGYRIQPAQVLGYPNEVAAAAADPMEGITPRPLGLPIAIAIGIGEPY